MDADRTRTNPRDCHLLVGPPAMDGDTLFRPSKHSALQTDNLWARSYSTQPLPPTPAECAEKGLLHTWLEKLTLIQPQVRSRWFKARCATSTCLLCDRANGRKQIVAATSIRSYFFRFAYTIARVCTTGSRTTEGT